MAKTIISAFVLLSAVAAFAAEPRKIKAKWFEADISPDVGALIAGYGENDVSVAKYDSLLASGICLNDGTLTMVKTAQDAMVELRRRIFPDADTDDDPYPDNQNPPIVNMPGMYKGSKWSH